VSDPRALVQFTFSSYPYIDLWERDSGSYQYLGLSKSVDICPPDLYSIHGH
jgi:hypothetical protein